MSAPRILIASAAMGGGHLQISHEMRRRLHADGMTVRVVDVLEEMPSPTGTMLKQSYPLLVKRMPNLYESVYAMFFRHQQAAGERVGIPVRLMLAPLQRIAAEFGPDLVISTYPLCTVAIGRLRAQHRLPCPTLTVVTTFSLNSLWLHPAVDHIMCLSPSAAAEVKQLTGKPASTSGPVVRPEFSAMPRPAHRGGTRTALITTGSLGLAGAAEQASATVAAQPGWRAVVLCGRDERLRRHMARIPGVQALGWVSQMAPLMARADVLIDNAAGMTSKEALVAGLPIITYRPLPGHGRDDAAAMSRLGVNAVETTTGGLHERLAEIAEGDAAYRDMVARGRALCVDDPLAPVRRIVASARLGDAAGPLHVHTGDGV